LIKDITRSSIGDQRTRRAVELICSKEEKENFVVIYAVKEISSNRFNHPAN
jgi:hypothetical protein